DRHDRAAGRRNRGRNRLESCAITIDGEGKEVAPRIRAARVGKAVERDGARIEEAGTTSGENVGRVRDRPRWQTRELRPPPGRDVERDDLNGVFAGGVRSQIGIDYGPSIWAE